MAIKIQQKGLASTYGKLAHLAGVSQAERRRAEVAEQRAAQRDQMVYQAQQARLDRAARVEMQEYDAQMRVETEKRAKAWELEKMQIRSQTDFQMEEEDRIRSKKEYDSAIRAVQKSIESGQIDGNSEQTKNLLLSLKVKRETGWAPSLSAMREPAVKTLTFKQRAEKLMVDALERKLLPESGTRESEAATTKEAEIAWNRYQRNLSPPERPQFGGLPYYNAPEASDPEKLPSLTKEEFLKMWYSELKAQQTKNDPLGLNL